MNVLVVDNNINRIDWGSSAIRQSLASFEGVTIETRRGPERDLPKNIRRFQRIIFSGSKTSCFEKTPWTDELDDFILKALNEKIPVLGICYGHQALARVLGSTTALGKGVEPEFGWVKIKKHGESRLFKNLPMDFYAFEAHFESVMTAPRNTKITASSELCSIQAFEVAGSPAWGIQFHPEVNLEGAARRFAECRKNGSPKKLLREKESKELFDPKFGEMVFRNFLECV